MNERRRLLVLDDDQQIVDVVAGIAERAGFETRTCSEPSEFEPVLAEHDPDVLVLDLQMPGLDGIEVMRMLAERQVRAGIVILTGMDQRTIAAAASYARSRGLDLLAAVQKPFVPEELLAHLRAAVVPGTDVTLAELEAAIAGEALIVHYQPVVRRFADGSWDIASVEALVRWDHPARGLLLPDRFLAIGERHGLGRALTDFVIQRGIEQLKGWDAAGIALGLRVNVSAALIADLDFPDRLDATLGAHEIDASRLTLEINEAAILLGQQAEMMDILTRLRVKDINLAIDDFGIGYSSLTQLFELPFNEMKIDRSLTAKVPQSKEGSIMVEALIDLAHKLHLSVSAEGVESVETLEHLGGAGCDSAQGYFISEPLPAAQVPDVVKAWSRRLERAYAEEITIG